MTLSSYGRHITLEELASEMPDHSLGLTALDIVNTAKRRGLGVRGYHLTAYQLPKVLIAGDILHLRASHFVVFDRAAEDGIHLLDPATGARVVDLDRLEHEYSGVALLFGDSPMALDERLDATEP